MEKTKDIHVYSQKILLKVYHWLRSNVWNILLALIATNVPAKMVFMLP